MRKGVVVLAAVLFLLAGCAAAGVNSIGVVALPDGSTVDYRAGMAPQPWGIDAAVIDRYQTRSVFNEHTRRYEAKSELIAKDAGFSDGLGKKATIAWGTAAISGGSLVGAAAVLRPDQTNVNAGNNSGNMKQTATGGAGGAGGSSSANASSNQTQVQGQSQVQLQNQTQTQTATGGSVNVSGGITGGGNVSGNNNTINSGTGIANSGNNNTF